MASSAAQSRAVFPSGEVGSAWSDGHGQGEEMESVHQVWSASYFSHRSGICCPCPSATGQVCTFSSFLGFWVLGFRVPKFSSILGLQNVGRWNSFTKLECLLFLSPFWHLLLLPICNKAGLYVFFFSYA